MERTITVTGSSKISVRPDTMSVRIRASGKYKDYDETVKQSAKITEKVRIAVSKAGFDANEVKSADLSINTAYNIKYDKYGNEETKIFDGFRFRHSMHVDFDFDNEMLGRLMYELSRSEAPVEISMAFKIKNTELIRDELLSMAVKDSKNKAVQLSNASGATLGDIISINYSWNELRIKNSRDIELYDRLDMLTPMRAYDYNIVPDDITAEDTVKIIWEIK